MAAIDQFLEENVRRQQELSGPIDAAMKMVNLSDRLVTSRTFGLDTSAIARSVTSPIVNIVAEQARQSVQALGPLWDDLITVADRSAFSVVGPLVASLPHVRILDGITMPGVRLTEMMGTDFLAGHQVAQRLVDSLPRFELPTLTVQFPDVSPTMMQTVGEVARFATVIEGWAPTRDRLLDLVVRAAAHEAETVERVLSVDVTDRLVLCPRCFTPTREGRIVVVTMDGCTSRPLLLCPTCSN